MFAETTMEVVCSANLDVYKVGVLRACSKGLVYLDNFG